MFIMRSNNLILSSYRLQALYPIICGLRRRHPSSHLYRKWQCWTVQHRKSMSSTASDFTKDVPKLGSTTILVQDGLNIQELPILVQKVKLHGLKSEVTSSSLQESPVDVTKKDETAFREETVTSETEAVKDGLGRCVTLSEIFSLLEMIPVKEVTPEVATYAFRCIATLKANSDVNSFVSGVNVPADDTSVPSEPSPIDTFAWRAVIDRLVQTICCASNASVLLDGLEAVLKARIVTNDRTSVSPVDRLVEECLVLVAKGRLTVEETCSLANLLATVVTNERDLDVDKLWPSFADQFQSIDEKNVARVYEILPLFKKSRKLIFGLLEKRVYTFWWLLKNSDVNTIFSSLTKIDYAPKPFMAVLTKWFNLNIHAQTETDIQIVVESLRRLDYFDSKVERATERYLKARNVKLEGTQLVTAICDLCRHFRFSSPIVLNVVGPWFENHAKELTPYQICRIAGLFGVLGYVPPNGNGFFGALEDQIESKFSQFRPEDLVELLLSCTYIQRYPLNFVRKLFNPFFLNHLNDIKDESQLLKARFHLKLLDTAMYLECPLYIGPILHKERVVKSLQRDSRLRRLHTWFYSDLELLFGNANNFSTEECIPTMPLADIYVGDYMFNVDVNNKPMNYQGKHGISKRKVVIIHLPEHFTTAKSLIGLQAARIRHLKILGYEVIQLNYKVLEKLRINRSIRLDYLKRKLF